MKTTNLKSILTIALITALFLFCLTGCGLFNQNNSSNVDNADTTLSDGGVLYLKVNPEIEISYDNNGIVTGVTARNDDALKILANYSGFQGKECRQVVSELVTAIGEAGYLIEEVDGENREITIEIEAGSRLPHDTFIDDIVSDVRNCVSTNAWASPVEVLGESDYGITDYIDTDYGPENDGVTDYNDTDYGPNNDGITDYDDTDYGPNNDGITDYDDTDYGPNNDGVTDYDDTDYGPNNDGVTDYDDTDYGPNNDGVTDYNDTDYGVNNDGVTDYSVPATSPSVSGDSNYNDGNSNYDGGSNYDSDSGYGD